MRALAVVWGTALCITTMMAVGPTFPAEPIDRQRQGAQRVARLGPEAPVTASDLRIGPANNSPAIAADPADGRFVVIANRLDAPDFGCSLSISGDGGDTWERASPVPKLPKGAGKCYAPEIAFDRQGVLYYLFVGLKGAGNTPMGAFLTTSADRARTFSRPVRVLGPERYMVRMALDTQRGGMGRLHLVWLQARSDPPLGGLGPPPNPIMSSFSDDGGKTFSKPVQVSDPKRDLVVAPALSIGRNSAVHVIYYDLQDDQRDYQGLEGPVWEGNWSLVVSTSRNGGRSFSHSEIDSSLAPPERVMLIFTMSPPALVADNEGGLTAAWYDARNADWDVFASRSTDRGRTWAPPERMNDDPLGNGRRQYLPRLSVSAGGRVDAVFYDRREDPENLRNDVFFTFSLGRKEKFAANVKLTSEKSNSRIGQSYQVPSAKDMIEFGGRLGLLSTSSGALAAWTDTRNHIVGRRDQDIVARRVVFSQGETAPVSGSAIEDQPKVSQPQGPRTKS